MARRFLDCEPLERCILLNALQYHSKRPRSEVIRWCSERWGSEPQYVIAAAKKLCLIESTTEDGQTWWERPSKLVALWWWRQENGHRHPIAKRDSEVREAKR